ncbi:carboxy-S-adenosyl-L-methionine synthase CmoA [Neptunicella marina]|uniref:Carboxy-S-adenosyl-L-methionine synthase n=1 Tax=Neptunicella marina TaxID=2125989 RepID=A0A8J6IR50_9ALTE|nr:carboxy-S-adenosyl-L-methionine synthase CmoA [Neptunicella marina]
MSSGKDAIYSVPQQVEDFRFDKSVAEVFPDMIQRSVPGYNTIIDTIGQLAGRYQQPDSHYYDLGCSLGAATLSMRRFISAPNSKIIAIDNSEAMLERCRSHLNAFTFDTPVELKLGDIRHSEITNAAVVVMNFTLQFIQPDERDAVIQAIYNGLKPGGILILSEKMRHEQKECDELVIDLHHEFKRRNGYSELEISQKRTAIENVMKINSFGQHQARLKQAGFNNIVHWFQCFNFGSIVAIKD